MSIKKCEYIRGTREEIREYLEKELNILPTEQRNTTMFPPGTIARFYASENQTFEKQIGDKTGFMCFFYLEADSTVEWTNEVADEDGIMQKVPSVKLTLVKIDLFIVDK